MRDRLQTHRPPPPPESSRPRASPSGGSGRAPFCEPPKFRRFRPGRKNQYVPSRRCVRLPKRHKETRRRSGAGLGGRGRRRERRRGGRLPGWTRIEKKCTCGIYIHIKLYRSPSLPLALIQDAKRTRSLSSETVNAVFYARLSDNFDPGRCYSGSSCKYRCRFGYRYRPIRRPCKSVAPLPIFVLGLRPQQEANEVFGDRLIFQCDSQVK